MGVGGLTFPSRAAVFFDRDGTLNRASERDGVSHPPASTDELELLPGAAQAIDALKSHGFAIVVITNQPDVARGTQRKSEVDQINARLRQLLPGIDALRCCFHDDADGCACRKPKPGMLLDAAAALNLDLARSFMVGDTWRDVGAGHQAGCTTVQLPGVAGGAVAPITPDYCATDMAQVTELILRISTQHTSGCSDA